MAKNDTGAVMPPADPPETEWAEVLRLVRDMHAAAGNDLDWREDVLSILRDIKGLLVKALEEGGDGELAKAIACGADAVMLSGETSVGKYALEAVRTMDKIARAVETGPRDVPPLSHVPRTKRGVISYAARDIGEAELDQHLAGSYGIFAQRDGLGDIRIDALAGDEALRFHPLASFALEELADEQDAAGPAPPSPALVSHP